MDILNSFGDISNPIVAIVAVVFLILHIVKLLVPKKTEERRHDDPKEQSANGNGRAVSLDHFDRVTGDIGADIAKLTTDVTVHHSHANRDTNDRKKEHEVTTKLLGEIRDANRDNSEAIRSMANSVKQLADTLR